MTVHRIGEHIARALHAIRWRIGELYCDVRMLADPKLRRALDKRRLEQALRDAGVSKAQALRAATLYFGSDTRPGANDGK